MARPEPEGIRLVLSNGDELDVGVRFVEIEPSGIAVFEIVTDVPPHLIRGVRCKMLPARTAIRFDATYDIE